MSASRSPIREQIEQQASLWTARLETGSLTEQERRELSDWLAADPEHGWILARYRELCAQLEGQVPSLTDSSEVDQIVRQAARWQSVRRWGVSALAVAAAIAIAAIIAFTRPMEVGTVRAERRALALEDGSRVELNAGTQLAIELQGDLRRVRLERGEALFQVARDTRRPFIVETPHGLVRVTGTVFNVRDSNSGVEVTVLEGSVQVASAVAGTDTAPLVAGHQALINSTGIAVATMTPDETQNIVAWRIGQLALQDAPLADAIARFAPYHTGTVEISPEAASLRVGGRFSLDDFDGFLTAVEQALPVNILRGEAGAVRVVARSRP